MPARSIRRQSATYGASAPTTNAVPAASLRRRWLGAPVSAHRRPNSAKTPPLCFTTNAAPNSAPAPNSAASRGRPLARVTDRTPRRTGTTTKCSAYADEESKRGLRVSVAYAAPATTPPSVPIRRRPTRNISTIAIAFAIKSPTWIAVGVCPSAARMAA